jgi:peptide/nickel transport system substrate-binding protein
VDLVLRMSSSIFISLQDEPGIVTIDIPTNGFDLIRLRSDQPPGNDPQVIQALKLATDREEIFELVNQGYGAVGKDSPIGPLFDAYFAKDLRVPERDVEAAKDLLASAGYTDGLELELHTPDTGGRPDLAAVLKNQWSEAGVTVDIVVEPESVYYGNDFWLEVPFGITGWGSRPVPQFYLDSMLECGAVWNESHFCDEEFDQLSNFAGSTMDEAQRVDAYHAIQEILIDRGPVIIPYYFAQFAAIRETFQGFELQAFAGRTNLRNVALASP